MSLINDYLTANMGIIKPSHLDKSNILKKVTRKFLDPKPMTEKEIEFLDWYFREYATKAAHINMMRPMIKKKDWDMYQRKCKTKGDLRRQYDFLTGISIDPL